MSNATYDAILRAIRPTWISKADAERLLAVAHNEEKPR